MSLHYLAGSRVNDRDQLEVVDDETLSVRVPGRRCVRLSLDLEVETGRRRHPAGGRIGNTQPGGARFVPQVGGPLSVV